MTSVLCGMEWAVSNHKASHGSTKSKAVAVIGWGLQGQSEILNQAVEELINEGITVVIAAGNENGKMFMPLSFAFLPSYDILHFPYLNLSLFVVSFDNLQRTPATTLPTQAWPLRSPQSMTASPDLTRVLPSPTMGPASTSSLPAPPLPAHPTLAPTDPSKLRAPPHWSLAWPLSSLAKHLANIPAIRNRARPRLRRR